MNTGHDNSFLSYRPNNKPPMNKMNTHLIRPTLRGLVLALAATIMSGFVAQAHPYASGVTVSGGTVQFYLNENADSVNVVFDNGTSATNNLGALTKGLQSFALGAHTNYSIIVTKVGSGVPLQTSNTNDVFVNFFGPRGVAVNPNPKTASFGRIYVANASAGTTPNGRAVGRGLYAINADQSDALAQGNTAKTAGMSLGGSTTYSPWKMSVGPDDMLYVSDGNGTYNNVAPLGYGVWMVKPDLSSSRALFVQATRNNYQLSPADGVISKPVVSGSYAAGNLVLSLISWDYTNALYASKYNNALQFNIGGSSLPYSTPGTVIVPPPSGIASVGPGVIMDMDIAPDGKIFIVQNSTQTGGSATAPLVRVLSGPNGTQLWGSWDDANPAANGGTDPYNFEYSIAISPDDRFMATLITTERIAITPLTNGVPDYSGSPNYTPPNNLIVPAFPSGTARQIAFDAADNVYEVSGGSDQLRVYSLGLSTTCITYNDQDGTNGAFQFIGPAASVSVAATTPFASQNGPTPGVFTLTRTGQNLSLPLTVTFVLSGTATNGVYTCAPAGIVPLTANTITFDANQTTTNVTIIPVIDSIPRLATSVILTLGNGLGYSVGTAKDTVTIVNTNFPTLAIARLDSQMYERTNDYARFRVTRLGDPSVDLPSVNLTYNSSTAVNGVNFSGPATLDVPAGAATADFQVIPYHDGVVTGNLAVTAQVASATDNSYNVSTPRSASITLVDSDDPPETVLWSDNLQTDTSANWTKLFATTNGAPDDETVTWAYDYSGVLIPPAPHSGSDTHGLYLTVNKLDTIPASAALNLYPNGQSFSGNYALRFDMCLIENSTSGQTEYALFGINHSGTKTNWFRSSATGFTGVDPVGWSFDGLFYDVESDGADLGEYVGYSSPSTAGHNPTPITAGVTAETMAPVFKAPPWTRAGTAANLYGSTTATWADVELRQVNGVIYWSINHSLVFAYTNTTSYTSGNIMLGYEDGFDSIGGSGGAVIYANARVINLASLVISGVSSNSLNYSGGVGSQFVLLKTADLTQPKSTWTRVHTNNTPSGSFTIPVGSEARAFYTIKSE